MNSRQKDIISITEAEGEVTIKELASRLGVSEMTIHRDLDYLQEQKYIFKKRGAAVFIDSSDRKSTAFYAEEKRRIGLKAASLLEDGQSVIFDNSTTALECAKFITPSQKHTFYTTNIETAQILSEYENSILYCSGGYYFHESNGFIGSQAEAFVSSVTADICFIGASGVSVERGITTPYPMHTSLQKAIIASAKTKILLCDHSKFGKAAMETVASLADIDIIVTDSGIPSQTFKTMQKYAKIIIA
ncbi:MAG: DeoR/GlpR transcriptional regulator [Ruminococcaceae bacterium]|nr:DeoR/GlpR transcriptional regulator [Oscillospiraceae bacterium]